MDDAHLNIQSRVSISGTVLRFRSCPFNIDDEITPWLLSFNRGFLYLDTVGSCLMRIPPWDLLTLW